MLGLEGTNSNQVMESEQTNEPFIQEETRPDIQGPVILHCRICRQFIGDSFTYVDQDPVAKTLTIQRSIGAIMDQEKLKTVTDKNVSDYGCTYFELNCKHCQEVLGKSYVTTTQPMDHLRGFITLNVDRLTLYELSGFGQDQQVFTENNRDIAQDGGAMGNEISNLEQEINNLRLDITKLKRFCLHLAHSIQPTSPSRNTKAGRPPTK